MSKIAQLSPQCSQKPFVGEGAEVDKGNCLIKVMSYQEADIHAFDPNPLLCHSF